MCLQTSVTLGLEMTRKQSSSVKFEHRFEKIGSAVIHNTLDLVVAGIVPEALVVEIAFIKLYWAAIVAKHEFLEGHEAHIPRITFLVRNESGDLRWLLNHWTVFPLPDAAIDVTESKEWLPVFENLRLC